MKIRALLTAFLFVLTGSAVAQDAPSAPAASATAAPTPAVDADATPWSTGTYTYDGSGNITGIGSDTYRYDAYGRLTKSVIGGVTETYTYDRYGNITTITTAGQTTTLAPDAATNRLPAPGAGSGNVYAGHDTAGRVTSFPSGTFQYDALDAVVYTTVGGEKIHLYTASDERIATIAVESPTSSRPTWTMKGSDWTLRDPNGQVLTRFKRTAAGAWSWDEDYIYRDGQLLAAEVATEHRTLHFHPDHLGTPRLITNHMGAKVAFHAYAPFGIERTSPAQDTETRKFTGHERDASNLDYMHARYYLPGWGRFLSVDPGKDWDVHQPQSWNMYAYVQNNALKYTDPDGRYRTFYKEKAMTAQNVCCAPPVIQATMSVQTALAAPSVIAVLGAGVGVVGSSLRAAGGAALTWLLGPGNAQRLADAVASPPGSSALPAVVYRGGGKNPSNLTPRPQDNGMLSARDSLSNPYPLSAGQKPPLPAGQPIQAIDTSKLPPGSVVVDGAPHGPQPQGHVSIGPNVPAQAVKDAIVETIKPD